jgi:hypothetical protein
MVNLRQSLINVVNREQAKGADRLDPKRERGWLRIFLPILTQTRKPPADRRDLRHSGMDAERGNPVVLLKGNVNRKEGRWNGGHRKMEKANAAL